MIQYSLCDTIISCESSVLMWLHIYCVFCDGSFPCYCCLCDCLTCTIEVLELPEDDTDFYDRMTVHRNKFLVNKTNRCTEFQFYWYYYSTCFGQPFCPLSGVLSRTLALLHFMQLWPFDTRSRMEAFHPTPDSKRFITTAYNVPKPMYG
jgi:hypothetical protein